MTQFNVDIANHDQGVIIRLHGDATLSATTALRDALQPVVERKPKRVVLDLAQLVFINSLGLGALLEFRQALNAHGARLRMAGASDRVADIFMKTRLAELFPMYPTAEEAIAAV
ncbi:MAG: anti-sigma factor antagonist [Planctomycetes bacterium]|nr:anti-sigma factor antagonist [Planctomycetota bacterium]